jgi:hypothetical protein
MPQLSLGAPHRTRHHAFSDAARDFDSGRIPVTHLENHDHESFQVNAGGRDRWWRTQPYAIALLTAAGAPLLHNGQEFGVSYPMPEPFQEPPGVPPGTKDPALERVVPRPLPWWQRNDATGRALKDLYRQLIALRRAHPALSSSNFHPLYWD